MAKEKQYKLEVEVKKSDETSLRTEDIIRITETLKRNSFDHRVMGVEVDEIRGIENIPKKIPLAKIWSTNFSIERISNTYREIRDDGYDITNLDITQNGMRSTI